MTKIKSKVEPHSILDDFGRKSVTFVHFGIIHLDIIADGQLSWQYPKNRSPPADHHDLFDQVRPLI